MQLLRGLPHLSAMGIPLVVGLSRKSMIGHLLGREVGERMPASLALAVLAVERGAAHGRGGEEGQAAAWPATWGRY
jgi:dihydropteroate synthase